MKKGFTLIELMIVVAIVAIIAAIAIPNLMEAPGSGGVSTRRLEIGQKVYLPNDKIGTIIHFEYTSGKELCSYQIRLGDGNNGYYETTFFHSEIKPVTKEVKESK